MLFKFCLRSIEKVPVLYKNTIHLSSSVNFQLVRGPGGTTLKTNLTPLGGSQCSLSNSAPTHLANIDFPGPGPPQSRRSLDSLLSRHALCRPSPGIHLPVSACGKLYSSRRWSKSISGGGIAPKFCMFHKRGFLPLSPVKHTKLRSCTSVIVTTMM